MTKITATALVITVGVLGVLLYVQDRALREQRRLVQQLGTQLNSMPKTPTIELQERCARQAEAQFKTLDFDAKTGDLLQDHYNEKLNRCFMQTTKVSITGKRAFTFKTVSDAFEGRVYGTLVQADLDIVYCEAMLPSGEEKKCQSSDEFDALVKQYIE